MCICVSVWVGGWGGGLFMHVEQMFVSAVAYGCQMYTGII